MKILLLIVISLLITRLTVWATFDCLDSARSRTAKINWVTLFFAFPLLGVLVYLLCKKKASVPAPPTKMDAELRAHSNPMSWRQ